MELLERYASNLSSYLWRKRWGDRSLYQSDQKKRHLEITLDVFFFGLIDTEIYRPIFFSKDNY